MKYFENGLSCSISNMLNNVFLNIFKPIVQNIFTIYLIYIFLLYDVRHKFLISLKHTPDGKPRSKCSRCPAVDEPPFYPRCTFIRELLCFKKAHPEHIVEQSHSISTAPTKLTSRWKGTFLFNNFKETLHPCNIFFIQFF